MFASKDAEIADLKKRLAATEKQRAELEKAHAPCDNLIASLRKQLAALELTRDYAKVSGAHAAVFRCCVSQRLLHSLAGCRVRDVWAWQAQAGCSRMLTRYDAGRARQAQG